MQIEEVRLIQQKLHAASYVTGGTNYHGLFERFDKDGNGELDFEEFSHMLKITIRGVNSRKLNKNEVKQLWAFIDFDNSGTVDSKEFVAFLETDTATFAGFSEMTKEQRCHAQECLVEKARRRTAAKEIQRVARGKFTRRRVKERVAREARTREKEVREVRSKLFITANGHEHKRNPSYQFINSQTLQARRQEQERLRRAQADEIMRNAKEERCNSGGNNMKRLKLKELRASKDQKTTYVASAPPPERSPSAKRLLNAIGTIQRKLRAASYTSGGTNYRKFFDYVDKNGSGSLDFDEFSRMVRKGVRGDKAWRLSDLELRQLWDLLDANGDNSCDEEEFVAFLEMDFGTINSGGQTRLQPQENERNAMERISSDRTSEVPCLDESSGTKTIFVGSTGRLDSLRDHAQCNPLDHQQYADSQSAAPRDRRETMVERARRRNRERHEERLRMEQERRQCEENEREIRLRREEERKKKLRKIAEERRKRHKELKRAVLKNAEGRKKSKREEEKVQNATFVSCWISCEKGIKLETRQPGVRMKGGRILGLPSMTAFREEAYDLPNTQAQKRARKKRVKALQEKQRRKAMGKMRRTDESRSVSQGLEVGVHENDVSPKRRSRLTTPKAIQAAQRDLAQRITRSRQVAHRRRLRIERLRQDAAIIIQKIVRGRLKPEWDKRKRRKMEERRRHHRQMVRKSPKRMSPEQRKTVEWSRNQKARENSMRKSVAGTTLEATLSTSAEELEREPLSNLVQQYNALSEALRSQLHMAELHLASRKRTSEESGDTMHAMNAAVAQGAVAGARRMLVTCQEQLPQLEATLASLGLSPTPKNVDKGKEAFESNRRAKRNFFPPIASSSEGQKAPQNFARSQHTDAEKGFLPEVASGQGFEPSPIGPFHRMLQTGGVPSAQEVLDSIDKGSYGFAGSTVAMREEVVQNPSSSLPNIKNRAQKRRTSEGDQYKIAKEEIDKILDETPDIGGPPTSAGSKPTFQGQIRATQRRVEEGNGGMLFQLRRRYRRGMERREEERRTGMTLQHSTLTYT